MNEPNLDWTHDMVVLDRTNEVTIPDISYPFALDELIGRQVGEGGPPICHIWRHPRAFIIGSRDNRLPGNEQAIDWLQNQGYSTLVRHSGGAAVPLDNGVLNLTLILPLQRHMQEHDLNRDFERMYALVRQTVGLFGTDVRKGEVKGSYCPGDYDLHIGGLKFCGIAQRRQMRAVMIQAFVNVEGAGESRAELVRSYYQRAGAGAAADMYPQVEAGRMTSLEESGVLQHSGVNLFSGAIRGLIKKEQSQGKEMSAPAGVYQMPEHDAVMGKCAELRERYAK